MLKKRDTRTSDDSSLRARYFPPSWRISFRGPHIHAYIYKERMEREEERSSGRSSLDRPERLFRVAVINKIDPSKLRSFIAASRLSRDYPRIFLSLPSSVERSMGRCSNEGEYRAEGETPPTRVLNSYINSEGNRAGGSCFESDRNCSLLTSPFLFLFFILFSISSSASASRKREGTLKELFKEGAKRDFVLE